MHLKRASWSDNHNEIKIKPFLKKKKNSCNIEFKLDLRDGKTKLSKLLSIRFLDKVFFNRKTKNEYRLNFLKKFILVDAIFNDFDRKHIKKCLLNYKINRDQKLSFEIKIKGKLNKNVQNIVSRIYISFYSFYKSL